MLKMILAGLSPWKWFWPTFHPENGFSRPILHQWEKFNLSSKHFGNSQPNQETLSFYRGDNFKNSERFSCKRDFYRKIALLLRRILFGENRFCLVSKFYNKYKVSSSFQKIIFMKYKIRWKISNLSVEISENFCRIWFHGRIIKILNIRSYLRFYDFYEQLISCLKII